MDLLQAIILGLIQGITEWFPVSSSGHLVLAQEAMSIQPAQMIFFDLVLHAATLGSVVIFLRKDLLRIIGAMATPKRRLDETKLKSRRLGWLALLATIPAVIAGFLIGGRIDDIFNPMATSIALLFTGILLWVAEMPSLRKGRENLGVKDALVIGGFQALSIAPGISRSGSTIASGCYVGLGREIVAVFSFVLSIPIIIAAIAYQAATGNGFVVDWSTALPAAAIAFVAGLLALKLLFGMIKKYRLRYFAGYCWCLGIAAIILLTLYG